MKTNGVKVNKAELVTATKAAAAAAARREVNRLLQPVVEMVRNAREEADEGQPLPMPALIEGQSLSMPEPRPLTTLAANKDEGEVLPMPKLFPEVN